MIWRRMHVKPLLAAALAAGAAVLTTACQTVQGTDRSAVEYNRAFAKARDEITLLNVLRASARQPLQFSTISSVQGAVRSGASIRVPFVNLIDGGPNAISPEVTLSARNPTVSITPLATREFIQGISRPLASSVIDDLLVQGWPLDVVLGLTVGGVVCPSGTVRLNFGDDLALDAKIVTAFRNVRNFGFEMGQATPYAQLRMTGSEALAALREGAGSQRRIGRVTSLPPGPPGAPDTLVELVNPGQGKVKGLDFSEVCGTPPRGEERPAPDNAVLQSADRQGGVLLRSVFGIFHYLGRVHAATEAAGLCSDAVRAAPRLLRIETSCPGRAPGARLVETEFAGRRYALARDIDRAKNDRTLESLSLLTYLVDLQTSETSVRSSVPFIAITQP